MVVTCPGCRQIHRSVFPTGVSPKIGFGPQWKAYAVGLVERHFVALDRTCELMADQDGVRPSDGAVQNWILDAGQRLADDHAAGREAIRAAEVANFDESGMWVGGQLNWLHVAATDTVVHYTVHPQWSVDGSGRRRDSALLCRHGGARPLETLRRLYGLHPHVPQRPLPARVAVLRGVDRAFLAPRPAPRAPRPAPRAPRPAPRAPRPAPRAPRPAPRAPRHLLVEDHEVVVTARAAGLTALLPDYVAGPLARYDRQVSNGLRACPGRPPKPGRKDQVKQHPATTSSCDLLPGTVQDGQNGQAASGNLLLLRLRDY